MRLIQITDTHLYSNINQELLGTNPFESFKAILETIKHKEILPDLFILTGDLSQDGHPLSYEYIADEMSDFNVPCYVVPGNHDNPDILTTVYPRGNIHNQKHLVLPNWQIILLNSYKNQSVEGHLSTDELHFLTNCLTQQQNLPAVIMLHHPAWTVGSDWVDRLRLDNCEEFWAICKKHNQIKMVVSGHVHQEYSTKINNIECFSTPSTTIQFKPNVNHFELDDQPQGYRVIELYDDGKTISKVHRLEKYVGKFLSDATGY
jgi:Icc protein